MQSRRPATLHFALCTLHFAFVFTPSVALPTNAHQVNTAKPAKSSLSIRLLLDSFGRLVLTDAQGIVHSGVVPVRAFPLSDAEHWIALCDGQGRELALIEDT